MTDAPSEFLFDCPAEGCAGGFTTSTVTDEGGTKHLSIETNCSHAVLPCEFCENPILADEIVLASPPDAEPEEKTAKAVLCEGCARACRVDTLPRWSE